MIRLDQLFKMNVFRSKSPAANAQIVEHPLEIDIIFRSLEEWLAWRAANPIYFERVFQESLVTHVLNYGLREPLTSRWFNAADIERGAGLREGLNANGIISRHRSVMHLIEQSVDVRGAWPQLKIYAPEAMTAFALRMRSIFPKFLGSEFTLDEHKRADMFPIPFQDLTNLSLPSDTFDLVISNDVLEHVPNVDLALFEIARILKPGHWHFGTYPFVDNGSSIIKAKLEEERIIHLTEPEYHGNPFDEGGSIVFELPGWDILPRALKAGFSDAFMRLMISRHHGYLAEGSGGSFVLCCRK